jgi:16S rRNA (adenine1518-N6/adenine1519-N6)-dimethyltransferase
MAEDPRVLLRRFGLRPKKSLGQNFMVDRAAVEKIAAAADLTPSDQVLEIGPGLGTLTARLLELAGRVVAVELDAGMVSVLREVLREQPGLVLVQGDILDLDPADYFDSSYKLVANVPYYITSPILRHVLEARTRPERIVLTVQKEVAQRIVSTDRLSLLAISIQFYGRPVIAGHIPAGAFFPAPKVDSAVVRIDVYPRPAVHVTEVEHFFRVVRAGFAAPRKQLHNNLAGSLGLSAAAVAALLDQASIDPRRRAETLSLEEWASLEQILAQGAPT